MMFWKCRSCSQGERYVDVPFVGTFCMDCVEGRFQSRSSHTRSCDLCPYGQYQGATGASSCISCTPGRSNSRRGSTSSAACSACTSGTYQQSSGTRWCRRCPAGRFNTRTGSDTISDCEFCSTGQFQQRSGQSSCRTCPAGQFADETGLRGCKSCPAGTFQHPSSDRDSECTLTPPGYWVRGDDLFCPLHCHCRVSLT